MDIKMIALVLIALVAGMYIGGKNPSIITNAASSVGL